MSQPRCEHCRFWDQSGPECHRYAPRPEMVCLVLALEQVGDIGSQACWPVTYAGDWCGEFEGKR
jgi:hypothetical protein